MNINKNLIYMNWLLFYAISWPLKNLKGKKLIVIWQKEANKEADSEKRCD